MSTTPLTDEAWRQWQDGETEGDGTHREAAYHMKDFASTLESTISTLTRKLAEAEGSNKLLTQAVQDANTGGVRCKGYYDSVLARSALASSPPASPEPVKGLVERAFEAGWNAMYNVYCAPNAPDADEALAEFRAREGKR